MKIYDRDLTYTFIDRDGSNAATTIVKHGNTSIIVNVSVDDWVGYNRNHLICKYYERLYAINKIPPGFSKREQKKPYESYVSDLVYRSLINNISENFRFKITIECILVEYEQGAPIETLLINGAYVALRYAGVPCSSVASLMISYMKEWSLGNYGDKTCVISGNLFNVSLMECYNIPCNEMQNAIHFAYSNIKTMLDFNEVSIKKAPHSAAIERKPPVNLLKTIYIGDIVDPRLVSKAYKSNDISAMSEYKKKFIDRYADNDAGEYHFYKCLYNILKAETIWNGKRFDHRSYDASAKIQIDSNVSNLSNGTMVQTKNALLASFISTSSKGETSTLEYIHGIYQSKFIVHLNSLNDQYNDHEQRAMTHILTNILRKYINTDKFLRIVVEIIRSQGNIFLLMMRAIISSISKVGIKASNLNLYNYGIISDTSDIYLSDMSHEEEYFVDAAINMCIASDISYCRCIAQSTFSWKSLYNSVDFIVKKHEKNKNHTLDNSRETQAINTKSEHSPQHDSHKTDTKDNIDTNEKKNDSDRKDNHGSDRKLTIKKDNHERQFEHKKNKDVKQSIKIKVFKTVEINEESLQKEFNSIMQSMDNMIHSYYKNGIIHINCKQSIYKQYSDILDMSISTNPVRQVLDYLCHTYSNKVYTFFYGSIESIDSKHINIIDKESNQYTSKITKEFKKYDLVLIQKKSKAKMVEISKIEYENNQ